MAVDSGRPIVSWEPPAMIKREEEEFDGIEITLEEELVHEYDFTTLFKPNDGNVEEYRMRYNMACKIAEQSGQIDLVAELVDIRFEARRQGMENLPLILEVSPYTDEGAAICYGYVEGAMERNMETQNLRRQFEAQYMTVATADGNTKIIKVS